jgi:hypothetical protein
MLIHSVKKLLKRLIPRSVLSAYRKLKAEKALSKAAKLTREKNRNGLPAYDCGPAVGVKLASSWLCRAQDQAQPQDGGVARHFSLNTGWCPSYPETTGYIVPTFIQLDSLYPNKGFGDRARRMLDWFVAIQMDGGGFQGGLVTSSPVAVTFNTGQILLGLSAGAKTYQAPEYVDAMKKAANWLVETQDADGCWRKHGTPFAAPGEKTYETHVAWALLEADRVMPDCGFGEAGMKQIRWALTKLRPNGWLEDCCLGDREQPPTHTLGYALRGIIEGYRFSDDPDLLSAATSIGRGLLSGIDDDGSLPGGFDQDWNPAVDWVCLTGSVQNAANFLDLFKWTGDSEWREAALALNQNVRRSIVTEGDPDVVGAIAGSFPIDGLYGPFEYLNWAAKFFIDAQLMEISLTPSENS